MIYEEKWEGREGHGVKDMTDREGEREIADMFTHTVFNP